MKIKFLIMMMLVLMYSCNRKGKLDTIEDDVVFKIINIEKSEFKKVGNNHQYEFIGKIQNTSENIFDKVITDVQIELELENGNVITEVDYGGSASSMFSSMIDSQTSWKQNENRLINGLGSGSGISSTYIPDHYFEYPVKKVYAVLKLESDDLINRTKKEDKLILDVTDKWKEISKTPKKSNARTYYGQ